MKRLILCFIFVVTGAILLSSTDGFSYPDRCSSFTGTGCNGCHPTPGTNGQPPCPNSCSDNDGDGYGNPGDSSCRNGSATDCNDRNASINPGAEENCNDGIDNNCNNLTDAQDPNALNCPSACIDNDGDGYAENCSPFDCDDNNASINPGAFEICDDGTDNDCNNNTDCDDKACTGDPACLAEFCSDYSDRGSCKADPRCNWSGKNKWCYEVIDTTIFSDPISCKDNGGRWNKRKAVCR